MGEVLFVIGIILLLTVVPVVIEVICINFFIDGEDGCLTLIFAIVSGLVIICAIIGLFIYDVKYGVFGIVGYAVLFIIVFFIGWLVTGRPAEAKKEKLQNKLLEAINSHDKEAVQKLIENGVDVKCWVAPLKVAVENSDKDMVSFLIEKGADVNFKYYDGRMEYLLDYTTDEEIIGILRNHGAKTQEECDMLNDDLFSAISNYNKEKVKSLISQGADVNSVRCVSNVAEGMERAETTPLLLADVNFKYYDGRMEYLLDYTTDEEIIGILRNHGAKTQEECDMLNDDLFSAISNYNKEKVKSLISQGADVNSVRCVSNVAEGMERAETTPLLLAVYNNDIEMVKLLVKNGADIRKQLYVGEYYNYQPLYNDVINYAKYRGFMDIANFLEQPYLIDTQDTDNQDF
ncbi:MAG: ankyrin repeat domain-containing protein [Treponemataceae bacterium]|nr:ankyrin repeat domain-containing protein [Treponemataceae bacterium]